jgi:hypothetical protein
VVLIALRNGRFHRKTVRILAVGLLFGSGVCVILRLADDNGPGGALASLWTALILLLTAFLIVRQVVYQPRITGQSIYGVLSAYMIIGLIFSAVYVAMWKFGGPFFVPGEQANTQTFQYFSFTTLTTLGYGDFTAAGNGSRAIAVMEALTGQVFLATLVARLVAAYRSPAEPKNEPRNPPPSRFPPRGVRNGTRMINGTIPLGSTRRSLHQRPAYRRRVDGSPSGPLRRS